MSACPSSPTSRSTSTASSVSSEGSDCGSSNSHSAFVLRSVDPAPDALEDREVTGFRRLGKRIVFEFEDDLFLVLHLMIAGRLRWRDLDAKGPGGPKRNSREPSLRPRSHLADRSVVPQARVDPHRHRGEDALEPFRRDGLEVLDSDLDTFREALTKENRTLKRAMTDPRILSGIGNAYSDEILFHAGLSPVLLTQRLDGEQIEQAVRSHPIDAADLDRATPDRTDR